MKRWCVDIKKRKMVEEKTGGKCFYCGIKLTKIYFFDERGNVVSTHHNWHVDHVKPLSKGGTYDIENLVPSCPTCNMKKGAKYNEPEEQNETN